jgi:hypothetical protein
MKKFFAALAVVMLLAAPAFGLSGVRVFEFNGLTSGGGSLDSLKDATFNFQDGDLACGVTSYGSACYVWDADSITTEDTPSVVKANDATTGRWILRPSESMEFESKTADYTVQTYDNSKVFDNEGAAASVTFTLPSLTAAMEGTKFHFLKVDAHTVDIDPASGDQIVQLTGSAGDYVRALPAGNPAFLSIMAKSLTTWVPIAYTSGTVWTEE